MEYSRELAAEQRRARILRSLVEVVAERGYAGASVQLIAERAGVGRDGFYRLFPDVTSCFEVVLDLGLSRALEIIARAFARERTWLAGMRTALASLLALLDSEPLLARVWLVESLGAGSVMLGRRERNLARLREQVSALWPEPESRNPPPLAIEGLVGSVLSVVHTHLVTRERAATIELLGPLMGMIVRPYLGTEFAEREIERARRLVSEIEAGERTLATGGPVLPGGVSRGAAGADDHAAGAPTGVLVPSMLSNPRAHRLRQCLVFVVANPELSNREIAAGVGIAHDSQASKLLSGLLAEGLLIKREGGAGRRNVWSPTPRGAGVARLLSS